MRKVLVMALAFGAIASLNAACTGDDDDDDGHTAPNSITISGGNAVTVGSTLQLTATGNYDGGETDDLTATSTWTSSSNGVATVSATGLVTGVAAGTTTISAEHDEVVGQVVLTVSTGAAATFNATVSGDWSGPHGAITRNYYARIIDTATSAVVLCTSDMGVSDGLFSVTGTGVLVAGHSYRAEAFIDLNQNGMSDDTGHRYQAVAGPVNANTTFAILHSGTEPVWAGTPCP